MSEKPQTIHDAVRRDDIESITCFVKNGASLDVAEKKTQMTPVQIACYTGSLESLHWLLWHGAEMNEPGGSRGYTAAHIACIRAHDHCLQALASNSCNLSSRDRNGSTPLHMCAAHGSSFCMHILLRHSTAELNQADHNGWLPSHFSAFHGRLGCLQLLHKWGCPLTEVDNNGNSPGHLAAQEGNLPCLKFIFSVALSRHQAAAARNDAGETPRDLAARYYKSDVTEFLDNMTKGEEEGCYGDADDDDDSMNLAFPAHVAAYEGNLEGLKVLVEQGIIHCNERDGNMSTPAHKAAGQGHLHVLHYLIETGADMEIRNSNNERPLDVARRFAQLACYKLLGGGGENGDVSDDVATDDDDEGSVAYSRKFTRKTIGALDRAMSKIEEFEEKLEIARENYRQLGGVLELDRKRFEQESQDRKKIEEQRAELEYERERREKMEMLLDELRSENGHLNLRIEELSDEIIDKNEIISAAQKVKRSGKNNKKNSSSKKQQQQQQQLRSSRNQQQNGIFIRRTFN